MVVFVPQIIPIDAFLLPEFGTETGLPASKPNQSKLTDITLILRSALLVLPVSSRTSAPSQHPATADIFPDASAKRDAGRPGDGAADSIRLRSPPPRRRRPRPARQGRPRGGEARTRASRLAESPNSATRAPWRPHTVYSEQFRQGRDGRAGARSRCRATTPTTQIP